MLMNAEAARNMVEEFSDVGKYLTKLNECIVGACTQGKRDLFYFVESEDMVIVKNMVRALREKGYQASQYEDDWQWIRVRW